jgi:3-phenylpropionate/trans-cinnamate dioxygenase ferredoxin subunit
MMASFVVVAKTSAVAPNTMKSFEVNGQLILLANWEGTWFATQDLCTHDDGTLSDGELTGGEVECPRHGARFDLQTGRATLPAAMPIKTFPVKIEGGTILVQTE